MTGRRVRACVDGKKNAKKIYTYTLRSYAIKSFTRDIAYVTHTHTRSRVRARAAKRLSTISS